MGPSWEMQNFSWWNRYMMDGYGWITGHRNQHQATIWENYANTMGIPWYCLVNMETEPDCDNLYCIGPVKPPIDRSLNTAQSYNYDNQLIVEFKHNPSELGCSLYFCFYWQANQPIMEISVVNGFAEGKPYRKPWFPIYKSRSILPCFFLQSWEKKSKLKSQTPTRWCPPVMLVGLCWFINHGR